jgi:hypothetical protein
MSRTKIICNIGRVVVLQDPYSLLGGGLVVLCFYTWAGVEMSLFTDLEEGKGDWDCFLILCFHMLAMLGIIRAIIAAPPLP